jgi:hypothetical protein
VVLEFSLISYKACLDDNLRTKEEGSVKALNWPGYIEEGKLKLNDEEGFKEHLKFMSGEVEVSVQKRSAHKSRQIEKYYWAVVLGIASEHTGYTQDELHEVNKARYLPVRVLDPMTGEYITVPGSTKGMKLSEQMEFVEAVKRDYAEFLSLYIPDPGEV